MCGIPTGANTNAPLGATITVAADPEGELPLDARRTTRSRCGGRAGARRGPPRRGSRSPPMRPPVVAPDALIVTRWPRNQRASPSPSLQRDRLQSSGDVIRLPPESSRPVASERNGPARAARLAQRESPRAAPPPHPTGARRRAPGRPPWRPRARRSGARAHRACTSSVIGSTSRKPSSRCTSSAPAPCTSQISEPCSPMISLRMTSAWAAVRARSIETGWPAASTSSPIIDSTSPMAAMSVRVGAARAKASTTGEPHSQAARSHCGTPASISIPPLTAGSQNARRERLGVPLREAQHARRADGAVREQPAGLAIRPRVPPPEADVQPEARGGRPRRRGADRPGGRTSAGARRARACPPPAQRRRAPRADGVGAAIRTTSTSSRRSVCSRSVSTGTPAS